MQLQNERQDLPDMSKIEFWLATSKKNIPHTVIGGHDKRTQEDFLIGRAKHKKHVLPGRISRTEKCLITSFDGEEITKKDYEILLVSKPTQWISSSGAPEAPHSVTVKPVSDTSVEVTWKKPPPDSWDVSINGYHIIYTQIDTEKYVDNSPVVEETVRAEETKLKIDKLEKSKKYEFQVKAYNSIGRGPASTKVYVKLGEQATKDTKTEEDSDRDDAGKTEKDDSLPEELGNAVRGGTTSDGKPLFIARAKGPDGVTYPGRLGPSKKVCYIPFNGGEIARERFEVLKYAASSDI